MKKQKRIKYLMTALIVIMVVSVGYLSLNQCYQNKMQRQRVVTQDALIKSEVQTAVSMLQGIYDKHLQGTYSTSQAEKLGADLLRGLRYNGDGYFFADTTEGVNVVLFGSDVEGTNRLDASLNGVDYVKEILLKGTEADGGYTNYWFPKKDGTEAKAKRAYSLLFEPFGWVVGTGYYLEDIK
ncbi:MAG: cache domain-containing protein [Patescibacteria group bacterium]|jgi:methyl-accepting chemotaxis protein